MPTFGFSAFLKLLSLNDKPQRTEIRKRILPGKGGYDYHRSMRLRSREFLFDEKSIEEVLASCGDISSASERASAEAGLRTLAEWRESNLGPALSYDPVLYCSPGEVFRVHFTPNFGLQIGGLATAIHIWNNIRPPLVPRMVYAALSLLPKLYNEFDNAPEDLAVLSLRGPRLFQLSEAKEHAVLGGLVVAALEKSIGEMGDDLGLPPPPAPGPHPPGP